MYKPPDKLQTLYRWLFGIILAIILTFFIEFIGSMFVIFKCYFRHGMKEYLFSQTFYLITFVIVAKKAPKWLVEIWHSHSIS